MQSFIKRCMRGVGFDLRRYYPASSEPVQRMAMLSGHHVNLVFDVGANVGQFAQSLRGAGYCGRIVSFEPLSFAWNQLLKVSGKDSLWEIAPRAALGSEDGEIEINVAANSVSSSVLNMLDAHTIAAPEAHYIGRERVKLRRLDSLASDYLRPDSIPFLKIDSQGYEDRILRGASGVLDRFVGLQLELALVPLYDGQQLFEAMLSQMRGMRFELWAISPVFFDLKRGRMLQVDATFFRF